MAAAGAVGGNLSCCFGCRVKINKKEKIVWQIQIIQFRHLG